MVHLPAPRAARMAISLVRDAARDNSRLATSNGFDPDHNGNLIFPNEAIGAKLANTPRRVVNGWTETLDGGSFSTGTYRILLTGADYAEPAIPEPGTMALLLGGALLIGIRKIRARA